MTSQLVELAGLLADLDPPRLAALVSMLPPDAVLAVRIGADVALDRADRQLAELLREDHGDGRYHREHPLPEYTRLQIDRWPPNGDRDEWIEYGPAGRPPVGVEAAA